LYTHERRQIERNKLAREKQLRETAEREKAAMEQRLMQYQEEIRLANEALVKLCFLILLKSAVSQQKNWLNPNAQHSVVLIPVKMLIPVSSGLPVCVIRYVDTSISQEQNFLHLYHQFGDIVCLQNIQNITTTIYGITLQKKQISVQNLGVLRARF
jgi:hypothetical protein